MLKISPTVVLPALILAATSLASGQAVDAPFEFLSIKEGLSQSTVHSITQDRDGYMWFGTEDGLNRYDGYEFTVFRHQPEESNSLADNYVQSLCSASDGTLWVGTRNGAGMWHNARGLFSRLPRDLPHSEALTKGECRSIIEDREQTVWFATASGLVSYNPSSRVCTTYRHDVDQSAGLPGDDVRCVCEDSAGTIWCGISKAGLLTSLDRRSGTFSQYPVPGGHDVWTLCEVKPGLLWIGTYDSRIYEFDSHTHTFLHPGGRAPGGLIDQHAWNMWKEPNGDVWVGTGGSGLFDVRGGGRESVHYAPGDRYILSLFEDNTKLLWVGTGKGICKYDGKRKRFTSYSLPEKPKDADRDIWAFYECANGSLLAGTNNNVALCDRVHGTLAPCGLSGHVIRSLYEDRGGILWAGTLGSGLIAWNTARNTMRSFTTQLPPGRALSDDAVTCIHEGRDGRFWLGTASGGLDLLDRTTGAVTWFRHDPDDPQSLSDNEVLCLSPADDGSLWIGTGNGLDKFDPARLHFARYSHDPNRPGSLSSSRVYSILTDSHGIFWVGTAGGLNKFDPATGGFHAYMERDGLPNDVIYGILEDGQGHLWLSTNKGISRFDPEHQLFHAYDIRDGLQSSEFNAGAFLKTRQGEMFFGGVNGLNSFIPNQVIDNPHPPPIVFTDFRVFDKSVNLPEILFRQGMIELASSDNFFSVEFTALDFSSPEKNRYAYKLEGFDKDWVSSGTRRYAAYTNLDPGEYVLHVRGSNNDGVWNTEGAALIIRVVPPFWKTWWFRVLAFLLVVSSAGAVVLQRFRLLASRAAAHQEMTRQLIDFQENERKRIGAGLHDGLGQNLLMIKNLAVLGLNAGSNNESTKEQLNDISSLSSQALAEVREISYNLRPYQLDRLGLTGALQSVVNRIATSSGIPFTVEMDNIDGLLLKQQEINVFRIVQETMTNIVKHSHAAHAAVRIRRTGDTVVLAVSDDGVGFESGKQGFGLTSMAERVRILGGSLDVDSAPKSGTRITARIPLPGRRP
jgi:signal transduction histidine kinase/ligand-binding sensor domain-containing protein